MFPLFFLQLLSAPCNLQREIWERLCQDLVSDSSPEDRLRPSQIARGTGLRPCQMFAIAPDGTVHPESRAPGAEQNHGLPSTARFDAATGLAQIYVSGIITQNDDDEWWGVTSQATLRSTLHTLAGLSPSAVTMHFDSPGGTALGNSETSALIRQFAEKVCPVHAYTESLMASAAMFLATAADTVSASPSAIVGSIGTIGTVTDSSKLYDRVGIKVHALTSGRFKATGYPGQVVTAEQLAERQKMVDYYAGEFTGHMATRRGSQIDACLPAISAALGSPVTAADLCDAMFQGQIWPAAAAPRCLIDGLHSTRRDHLQSLLK